MFYKMTLSAEEYAYARVQMTEEEAKIVNRVLNDMHTNLRGGGYCGSCGIDMETPSETDYPTVMFECEICGHQWETDVDVDCVDDYCPLCQENQELDSDKRWVHAKRICIIN